MIDTIRKKEKKLRKVFSLYIRLRDAIATTGNITYCRCVTCKRSVRVTSGELHAGHCFQGKNLGSKYNEQNVHAQCMQCNYDTETQGKKEIHMDYIEKTYGKNVLHDIQNQYNNISEISIADINDMIHDYKQRIQNIKDTYLLPAKDDGF